MRVLNFRLFFALIFLYLVPNLYLVLRVHFLGVLPDDSGINIASQLSWVRLLYEVIHEAMLLPLYFLIGKSLKNTNELRNKICSGYIIITVVYVVFSLNIVFFAEHLCYFMAQKPELISKSVNYIRLETIASIFATILKYSFLLLVLLDKSRVMYFMTVVQLCITILCDILLISGHRYSLNMGVNGLAVSNIITYIFILVGTIFYIRKQFKLSFKNLSYSWLKEWVGVGKYLGFESLIRNISFSLMVIRMVNLVQEQGNYWIANHFIWGFMLVPILALSDLIKRNSSEDFFTFQKQTSLYIMLTIIIIAVWIISMPTWEFFIKDIMNVQDYKTVLWLIRFQLVFYIVFAFNNIMIAAIYGRGKAKYLFYRSLYIDIVYYGLIFILYLNGVFIPSIKTISIMFGYGILISSIPTIYFYRKTVKEELSKCSMEGQYQKS